MATQLDTRHGADHRFTDADVRSYRALYRELFGQQITARQMATLLGQIVGRADTYLHELRKASRATQFQLAVVERRRSKSASKAAKTQGPLYSKGVLGQQVDGEEGK